MSIHQDHYIAAGCIGISGDEDNISTNQWTSDDFRLWWGFHQHQSSGDQEEAAFHERLLPRDIQESLLTAMPLKHIRHLFRAHWIRLEFSACAADGQHGIIRVYLLPDDIHRGTVDRCIPGLVKTRLHLLRLLDHSDEAWNGQRVPIWGTDQTLREIEHAGSEEETSLLQLFNSIPSPDPNPDLLAAPHLQDAAYDLLESKVSGLSTELHPYQRESAALMMQREAQPGQVFDPRLLRVKDRRGSPWYLDPVAGTILSSPRYYDGVSGGILAEEMGSGKTIMCLALILATKNLPTKTPEIYGAPDLPQRRKIASLADMAASCATRHAVAWKYHFDVYKAQLGDDFSRCRDVLERNPGYYFIPPPPPRRWVRYPKQYVEPPQKIYLSSASLVVVPNNLVAQWMQEISKHTQMLNTLVLAKTGEVPSVEKLLEYDIVLIAQSRFEFMVKTSDMGALSLSQIHFKRCIVDEGHRLGNSRIGHKSNLLIGLDQLKFSARWIVTGTPSRGLFGVDEKTSNVTKPEVSATTSGNEDAQRPHKSSTEMEKKDLERIGSIAALYLKARPWANSTSDTSDTPASWSTYLMLPKHNRKSHGRWDCLRSTLNSLIIRHPLDEVSNLLPTVNEKIVVLDGSYQDRLSLNLFSMMIILNAVQSQRTDQDYFFHVKQKRSLMQIVQNLKQASFFGGSFFTAQEITKSIETAEEFLREQKVPISTEDGSLLRDAINFGHLVVGNKLRNCSNLFHEMPVCVKAFPGGAGQFWSLSGESENVDGVCTSASLLLALQKLVHSSAGDPEVINSLLNGQLIAAGMSERDKILASATSGNSSGPKKTKIPETLSGNTKLGKDSPRKSRSRGAKGGGPSLAVDASSLAGPLELTEMISTVSSKLSYLIDGIVRHQEEEKIIVFYENENVAWYLASMLDVLQIQYLIYARTLSTERRSQYVNTFHHNPVFRVLLMDLSQAAFGLDMRAASRIYFINPVLNPQVEAQAIGRVRRISQKKPVFVETLVLHNSLDEVILERKRHMTQAEHRQTKSILDIRPIYNWIKNAQIAPMPESDGSDGSQMTALCTPQRVFGRGFGRSLHPDDGLVLGEDGATNRAIGPVPRAPTPLATAGMKRKHEDDLAGATTCKNGEGSSSSPSLAAPLARRIRFASDADES